MTNSREHSQEEVHREPQAETMVPILEIVRAEVDSEHRHNAPIAAAMPHETSGYEWKHETGEIQSYKHNQTEGWLHIDPQGQFHDRQAQPITRDVALEHAGHSSAHSAENAQVQTHDGSKNNDQGISL